MKTFRKDVSDQEVRVYMKSRLEHFMKNVVPRVPEDPEAGPAVQAQSGDQKKREPMRGANHARYASKKSRADAQTSHLRPEPDANAEEKELLDSIYTEPDLPVTARASWLGWSAYKMNDVKKVAIRKGVVDQFSANWGREHGGKVTLLALTDEGYKLLGKAPSVKPPENVSREHFWWATAIANHFTRKGVETEVEQSVNGKRVDVCLTSNGKRWAIEIELSPTNAVSNMVKDLEAGFDRVVTCCKDRPVAREVGRRLLLYKGYEGIKDKVRIRVLSELELVNELCNRA